MQKLQYLISLYTIVLLLLVTARLNAQQFAGNSNSYKKEQNHFFALNWKNPALMYHFPVLSYTDAYAGIHKRNENDLYIEQEGNKFYSNFFEANSYKKSNKDAYYGSAKYSYSRRQNVNWNTASNYKLFAPYVMADSIGGESKKETYMFKGGYSSKLGSIVLGIESSYQASLEYRNVDPRPKNTNSDFNLAGGVLLNVKNKSIGINLAFRKYKQTNNVRVFENGIKHAMFYMRGFGMSERSFSSVNSLETNHYDLKEYRFQLSYTPTNSNGLFLFVEYANNYFEFTYANTLGTISDMNSNILRTEIGYKVNQNNKTICGKVYGKLNLRKGLEYEYNENLKFLNKHNKYNQDLFVGGISLSREVEKKSHSSFVMLGADYKMDKSEYTSPRANQDISKVITSITYGIQKPFQKSMLYAKVKISHDETIDKQLQTRNLTTQVNKVGTQSNYEYLSASFTSFNFNNRFDYKISDKTTVFVYADITYRRYTNSYNTNYFTLSGGLTF